MRQRARGSIASLLLSAVAGLTLMAAALAGASIYESAQRLTQIRTLEHASAVTDRLIDAAEQVAGERDLALSALCARDADTRAILRQRMLRARSAAADAVRLAMASLARSQALGAGRAAIAERLRRLASLRGEIDSALAAPQRAHAALASRWSHEASGLIDDMEALWLDFVRPYAGLDAVITEQLRYKHSLLTIYDYSGRVRSLVGQIIAAGAGASPRDISELDRGQGVLDVSWRNARVLARQSGLDREIGPAFSDAKSHYDTLHDMLFGAFYLPRAGAPVRFPLAADLWFELADQHQDSLDTLRAVSRKAMRAQLDGLIAASERAIFVHALVLALALALSAAACWIVFAQVTAPINEIVAALLAATRGERVMLAPDPRRRDEIGKLVEVLHAFQAKAEEVRESAARLDEGERRLRAVVDNAVDGLITIDANGIIRSFNPACERIFGYAAEEVVGRNVSVLMPEPDCHQHDLYLARYAGTGAPRAIGVPGRELMALRKDGSAFPIDLSISGFNLPEGKFFSGILRDITLRKQVEDELARRALALERSNRELDDFAYIASHDLKEPLRGVHNHARFLLEDNGDKLDAESVKRLHRLVYLSQRMERLVNDLLYFSRLGRQDLAVQATDVNAVIADIEAMLANFLEERSAHIEMPQTLPTIICDRPRTTEAFRNLITNAVKYNDSAEKRVEVGFLQHARTPDGRDAFEVFYVRDNGRGIDREFHQDIFRIFKRLQHSEGADEGSGVGLTFVKKIIERHGGRIWVESAPGAGATFFFTLEAIDDAEHHTSAEAA